MAYFLILFAYLCGSIPFGKVAGRQYGIDIQKRGTGNIGFANVRRELGWRAGLMVLAGDVAKGFVPVWVAGHYLSTGYVMAVAVAALLGHIFPVWLKFRGGKGIATGLGATLAINPLLAAMGLIVYLVGIAAYHKSAPSSVTGAWSLPLFCLVIAPRYAAFYAGLAVLATWTHRSNIRKSLAGIAA